MMDTSYADAIQKLGDDVDRAVMEALEHLSNKDVADELRQIAQGWQDAA
jgi:hypothetical protein